jgi:hypothetical protein
MLWMIGSRGSWECRGFEEQLLLSVTRNHAPPGKRLAAQPSSPNTKYEPEDNRSEKVAESWRI